jgi:DNA-binding transcriptional regulator YiaG
MKKTTTIRARRPPRADFGTRLIRAAHKAIGIARGEAGLSQDKFAERFGFTRARVRDWEQGRSKPDGAVRAYLIVIDREREAVERALTAA